MSLPTDSKARKEIPMFSGLLKYFPDALAAVAHHSYVNNEKHNPGQPLHWSREKSSDHLECCVRHLTDIACGADKIEELKALAWRSLAELQLSIEAVAAPKTVAATIVGLPKKNVWHVYDGKGRPVPKETWVQVKFASGVIDRIDRASFYGWHDGEGGINEYMIVDDPNATK
jgi:hypothetical protein